MFMNVYVHGALPAQPEVTAASKRALSASLFTSKSRAAIISQYPAALGACKVWRWGA